MNFFLCNDEPFVIMTYIWPSQKVTTEKHLFFSRETFIFLTQNIYFLLNTLDGCHFVGTKSHKLFDINLTQFTITLTPPTHP